MALNIALQIDPPHTLKPATDTSMLLGREALKRGHKIFYLSPESVSQKNDGIWGKISPLSLHAPEQNLAFSLGSATLTNLSDMDVVLIRQDPPFDMAYITNCLLLEQLEAQGTLVLNRPASIRNFSEKLMPMQFSKYCPPTLISRDLEQIRAFHKEHEEVVIKPLYAYGGKGVFKLEHDGENTEALLEMMLENSREPLVIQKFLSEVRAEEKRIILIDGTFGGAIGRIPVGNNIRANMRVGGSAVETALSKIQKEIAEMVGAFAKAQGFMLVGLDVIGDWLTEINVTSPTGLMPIKQIYGTSPETLFWDAVERLR